MALSGSFTGTTNNQYIQPKITWSATQSMLGNYSDVTATLSYSRINSGFTTSGRWSGSITINGVPTTATKEIVIAQNSNTVAMTATVRVPHNNDGKKSVNISCTGGMTDPSISLQSTSCSSDITLDTIPRQATITIAPDFTDLDNPTIYFSNPANSTMNVWLEPDPVGEHLCERKNIANTGSYTWVLTDDEREQLRNKSAGRQSYTIRIGLYSVVGGATHADYKDKTFTMSESAATKPSVTMNIALNNGSLPSTFAGMYIQGKSRLDIALTAQGKYGASIKGFSAGVGTQYYWSTHISTLTQLSTTFKTDVITQSGNMSVSGGTTDSRGFTGTTSKQITVLEYSKPLVVPIGSANAISCYRSDGNGVRVGGSTSVWIKAKRYYYNLSQKNKCALQWRRRLTTEAWNDSSHKWTDLIAKGTTTSDEYNALISGVEFKLNESYAIQIRAIDDIGEYDIKDFEIPTQDVALHLGAGGDRIAVGTYCSKNTDMSHTFYSDWKAIFDKSVYIEGTKVANHVTEEGTKGAWKYRKWKDGTAELWGICTATHANGSVLGGRLEYPFILTGAVCVIGTLNSAGGNSAAALPWNLKVSYDLEFCEVWVHNNGSVGFETDSTVDASVYIVGRWK